MLHNTYFVRRKKDISSSHFISTFRVASSFGLYHSLSLLIHHILWFPYLSTWNGLPSVSGVGTNSVSIFTSPLIPLFIQLIHFLFSQFSHFWNYAKWILSKSGSVLTLVINQCSMLVHIPDIYQHNSQSPSCANSLDHCKVQLSVLVLEFILLQPVQLLDCSVPNPWFVTIISFTLTLILHFKRFKIYAWLFHLLCA